MIEVRRAIAWTVATWFGCGRIPRAPGTAGAIGAIPLYLAAARAGGRTGVLVAACAVTLAGVWAASVVARELGKKDPQVVVVDEVAGLLVTMLPASEPSWRAVAAGFVLFRLLDITKPWPIRDFEKLPGGWGIIMDDVVAGVVGACIVSALQRAGVLR